MKRRSSKENLVVVLVVKVLSRVCSPSIRLPNAKPAKIQANRKQGFKKDFPQHFNHATFSIECKVFFSVFRDIVHVLIVSQEFCILLFGFCFLWFLS